MQEFIGRDRVALSPDEARSPTRCGDDGLSGVSVDVDVPAVGVALVSVGFYEFVVVGAATPWCSALCRRLPGITSEFHPWGP